MKKPDRALRWKRFTERAALTLDREFFLTDDEEELPGGVPLLAAALVMDDTGCGLRSDDMRRYLVVVTDGTSIGFRTADRERLEHTIEEEHVEDWEVDQVYDLDHAVVVPFSVKVQATVDFPRERR